MGASEWHGIWADSRGICVLHFMCQFGSFIFDREGLPFGPLTPTSTKTGTDHVLPPTLTVPTDSDYRAENP